MLIRRKNLVWNEGWCTKFSWNSFWTLLEWYFVFSSLYNAQYLSLVSLKTSSNLNSFFDSKFSETWNTFTLPDSNRTSKTPQFVSTLQWNRSNDTFCLLTYFAQENVLKGKCRDTWLFDCCKKKSFP